MATIQFYYDDSTSTTLECNNNSCANPIKAQIIGAINIDPNSTLNSLVEDSKTLYNMTPFDHPNFPTNRAIKVEWPDEFKDADHMQTIRDHWDGTCIMWVFKKDTPITA